MVGVITDAQLATARQLQESSFTDRLVLEEDVIVKTQYKDTTVREQRWSGLGLVQPSAASRQPVLVGGQLVQQQEFVGKVKANTTVKPGWLLRIVASRDGNLLSKEFRVKQVFPSSLATCTYFSLEAT